MRGDLILIGASREGANMSISAFGRQEAVGEEVVIELRGTDRPLVAFAGPLVLVLAEDDVSFEVDFHGLASIVDPGLAVGPVTGSPFLRAGTAPDHGLVGLDVDRAELGMTGDDVDSSADRSRSRRRPGSSAASCISSFRPLRGKSS